MIGPEAARKISDSALKTRVNTILDAPVIETSALPIQECIAIDGCAVLQRFLRSEDVSSIIDALSCVPSDPDASVRKKRGVVFARRNLLSHVAVKMFVRRDEVSELVEMAQPGAIAVRAILFDKTGESNWTVPWHQDRSIAVREQIDVPGFGPWSKKAGVVHVQPPVEILWQMITLRFSLDACDASNGPLRTIAGTHRTLLTPSEIETAISAKVQQTCTTDAGGVVIMRPLLLHASSPAHAAKHRRVLHVEFGPRRLPGGLTWAGM